MAEVPDIYTKKEICFLHSNDKKKKENNSAYFLLMLRIIFPITEIISLSDNSSRHLDIIVYKIWSHACEVIYFN